MSAKVRYGYVIQGVHRCVSATGCGPAYTGATDSDVHLSTYDDLYRFFMSHGDEVVDGAPVVDLTPLGDSPAIVSLVWQCPIVSTMPAHADKVGPFGPIDHAPPGWVSDWWALHGARVGYWSAVEHAVVWR